MILSQVSLQHFRSYAKQTFSFSPHTTLIVGPNTAGKTNLLEALYMLAVGKSFRADADREVISWGHELARVKAKDADTALELVVTTGDVGGVKAPLKKYLVSGIARRQIDFIGNLRIVLFWPEDLELVTDSPSLRRKYLDSVLVQIDREYRRHLLSYEKGLRQRNKLLDLIGEGRASRNQLLFWNQLLIKSGSYLTDARAAFINFVNASGQPSSDYQLNYDKSVISEARLEQYKDEEVGAKATLVGPHRDNMVFTINKVGEWVHLSKFGSRGEQRLAILWLKLAELAYIHQAAGARPTLLLDDIFSELDEGHRKLVVDLIGKQQTIITTANPEVISLVKKKASELSIIELPVRS